MQHQRCYRVWIPSLNSKRITDTVDWHPTATMLPPRPDIQLVEVIPQYPEYTLPVSIQPAITPMVSTREFNTQTDAQIVPEVKRVSRTTHANKRERKTGGNLNQEIGAHTDVSTKSPKNASIDDMITVRPRKPALIPTASFLRSSTTETQSCHPATFPSAYCKT